MKSEKKSFKLKKNGKQKVVDAEFKDKPDSKEEKKADEENIKIVLYISYTYSLKW